MRGSTLVEQDFSGTDCAPKTSPWVRISFLRSRDALARATARQPCELQIWLVADFPGAELIAFVVNL